MNELLLIALLGSLGSILRFQLGGYVHRLGSSSAGPQFPYGTLFVNATGSFLFGIVTAFGLGGHLSAPWVLGLGVGFCGALTTFSTWAADLRQAMRERRWLAAVLNILVSLSTGLAGVWAGLELGK